MVCLHPICVGSRFVPCGKCPVCRQKYRKEMAFRLLLESKLDSKSAFFITLTYAPEHLPLNKAGLPAFSREHCKKFLDNLRYRLSSSGFGSYRYFLTCELGEHFGRSHYHLISLHQSKVPLVRMREFVLESWKYGRIQCDLASSKAMNYCTMYALKEDSYLYEKYEDGDSRKPFRLMSNRPGLCGTHKCLDYLIDYSFNTGNPEDFRFDIKTGEGSGHIPRYVLRKFPDELQEENKFRNIAFLDSIAEDLFNSKIEHSSESLGQLHNNYDFDAQFIARRKYLRNLRKSQKNNIPL